MSSTTAELSTPSARAKTAVGSSITAESVEIPPAPKAPAEAATKAGEPTVPAVAPKAAAPETMGTPTARVPEGSAVPPGTEGVSGVAPAEVIPRSVTVPTPVVASAPAPAGKPGPATIGQTEATAVVRPAEAKPAAASPGAAAPAKPAAPAKTAPVSDADSEAALADFLDRYLAAKRGDRLRLGNARFSEDTFRFVKLRVTEGYRNRVEEIQGWCDERRMLDLQAKLHHWLHGWVFIHAPVSFLLLMLTMWHAFVTLFYY
jgi:hypothetical protein